MLSGDEEAVDENLISWSISEVTSKLIKLNLEFQKPLEVSQGDSPDTLVIQVELSQFQDKNGQKLPESVVRTKSIPLQIGSAAEAEAAESAGAISSSATIAASSIQIIMSFIL